MQKYECKGRGKILPGFFSGCERVVNRKKWRGANVFSSCY
jgi:hypothetical protein